MEGAWDSTERSRESVVQGPGGHAADKTSQIRLVGPAQVLSLHHDPKKKTWKVNKKPFNLSIGQNTKENNSYILKSSFNGLFWHYQKYN